nr:MAG TPA: hypothetical protein [Caudoviricetes sp.]DAQ95623.1 MAG TPA: hypothetical protein [Caudoviricetes sp.]
MSFSTSPSCTNRSINSLSIFSLIPSSNRPILIPSLIQLY